MKAADRDLRQALVRAGARADALRDEARRITLEAVTEAAAAGMSQRAIGRAIGRSQPEVSRLFGLAGRRFKARSELGERLRSRRDDVIAAAAAAGARNVRVIGSVARGDDRPASDIDLLIDIPSPFSLVDLARLQRDLERILDHNVDVVPARGLRGPLAASTLDEARAL